MRCDLSLATFSPPKSQTNPSDMNIIFLSCTFLLSAIHFRRITLPPCPGHRRALWKFFHDEYHHAAVCSVAGQDRGHHSTLFGMKWISASSGLWSNGYPQWVIPWNETNSRQEINIFRTLKLNKFLNALYIVIGGATKRVCLCRGSRVAETRNP